MQLPEEPIFSHEQLDVYQASMDFVATATLIIRAFPLGTAALGDQLARAATSIALNTAEGSGEFAPKEKARFYRMALRSASECGAILDIALGRKIISAARYHEARGCLRRVVAMLTAMIRQQNER
jgi:four helix bundle protein